MLPVGVPSELLVPLTRLSSALNSLAMSTMFLGVAVPCVRLLLYLLPTRTLTVASSLRKATTAVALSLLPFEIALFTTAFAIVFTSRSLRISFLTTFATSVLEILPQTPSEATTMAMSVGCIRWLTTSASPVNRLSANFLPLLNGNGVMFRCALRSSSPIARDIEM